MARRLVASVPFVEVSKEVPWTWTFSYRWVAETDGDGIGVAFEIDGADGCGGGGGGDKSNMAVMMRMTSSMKQTWGRESMKRVRRYGTDSIVLMVGKKVRMSDKTMAHGRARLESYHC